MRPYSNYYVVNPIAWIKFGQFAKVIEMFIKLQQYVCICVIIKLLRKFKKKIIMNNESSFELYYNFMLF